MPIKNPRFRLGSWVFWKGGGGSANFIFMGVRIFPIRVERKVGGGKST